MKTKPLTEIDVNKLRIAHDPIIKRAVAQSKYDDLFRKLSHGQCIVCEPSQANALANMLRTYVKRNNVKGKVKSTERYTDGKGRVWLMHEVRAKA